MLTGSRLSLRMLVFAGLLTATGLTGLHVLSRVVRTQCVVSPADYSELGGSIRSPWGDVHLVGWLFVYSAIVVTAACISRSFSRDAGAFGSWLRTRESWEVAAPAVRSAPPPARTAGWCQFSARSGGGEHTCIGAGRDRPALMAMSSSYRRAGRLPCIALGEQDRLQEINVLRSGLHGVYE